MSDKPKFDPVFQMCYGYSDQRDYSHCIPPPITKAYSTHAIIEDDVVHVLRSHFYVVTGDKPGNWYRVSPPVEDSITFRDGVHIRTFGTLLTMMNNHDLNEYIDRLQRNND